MSSGSGTPIDFSEVAAVGGTAGATAIQAGAPPQVAASAAVGSAAIDVADQVIRSPPSAVEPPSGSVFEEPSSTVPNQMPSLTFMQGLVHGEDNEQDPADQIAATELQEAVPGAWAEGSEAYIQTNRTVPFDTSVPSPRQPGQNFHTPIDRPPLLSPHTGAAPNAIGLEDLSLPPTPKSVESLNHDERMAQYDERMAQSINQLRNDVSNSDSLINQTYSAVLNQANHSQIHRPDVINNTVRRSVASTAHMPIYETPNGNEIFISYRTPPVSPFDNINQANYHAMLTRADNAIEILKGTGAYQRANRVHHIVPKSIMAKSVIREVLKKHPKSGMLVYRTDVMDDHNNANLGFKFATRRFHDHAKHHTKEHMNVMKRRMRDGDSFSTAHKKAMVSVGV